MKIKIILEKKNKPSLHPRPVESSCHVLVFVVFRKEDDLFWFTNSEVSVHGHLALSLCQHSASWWELG